MNYANIDNDDQVNSNSPFRLAADFKNSSFEDFLKDNAELSHAMREMHESTKHFNVDPKLVKNIETICVCIYQLFRSRNAIDVVVCITGALNSLTGKSIVLESNRYLYELSLFIGENLQKRYSKLSFQSDSSEKQSEFNLLDSLSFLEDGYERVLGSKLVTNLTKLNNYLISFGLWSYFGLEGAITDYSQHETIFIQKNFKFGPAFFHTLFKTTLDLSKRIMILYKTGNYMSFFDDSSQISDWLSRSRELINQYTLINSGVGSSIDIFTARKNMVLLSEEGKKLLKWSGSFSNFEKNVLRGTVSELETVYRKDLSIISAMQTRKVPFSLLLHGTSGVGKSVLIDLLYQHYGKTFKLDISSEFKFSKNPAADFWDNFKSHQWCVVLDDIAFMNPNAAQGLDPTLTELLQIVNNVPYVVNQAALADKGTTPMQARLCLATTNTMSMNVHSYFSFPVAVSRRLPFVVTVEVKEEYASYSMLDSSKLPPVEPGHYPDIWNFTVHKVVVKPENVKHPDYTLLGKYTNIDDFLSWFSIESIKHDLNQEKVLQNKVDTSNVLICEQCFRSQVNCVCCKVDKLKQQCSSPYCDGIYNHEGQFILCKHDSPVEFYEPEVALGLTQKSYEDALHKLSAELAASENTINKLKEGKSLLRCVNTVFHSSRNFFIYFFLFLFNCFVRIVNFVRSDYYQHHVMVGGYKVFVPYIMQRYIIERAFNNVEKKLFHSTWRELHFHYFTKKRLAQAVAILSLISLAVVGLVKLAKRKRYPVQGVSSSMGCKPNKDAVSAAPNVWYNDNFEVCALDLSRASTSIRGLSFDTFKNKILANCFSILLENEKRDIEVITRCVCLCSNIFVLNAHSLQLMGDTFRVRIIGHTNNVGVNDTCMMTVKREEFLIYKERDLCFIKLAGLPCRKSITKFLCKRSFNGIHKGQLVTRTEICSIKTTAVEALRLKNNMITFDTGEEILVETWEGVPRNPTQLGDCGSALLLDSPLGYIFAGIHCAGADKRACTAPLFEEDMPAVLKFFSEENWNKNMLSMNAPDTNWKLESLHAKSPIRFIEQSGGANVYGSFQGGLVRNKSRVGPTAYRDAIKALGYRIKYGAPELSGWMPKRIALMDVLTIKKNIPLSDIKKCAQAYFDDIVKGLSADSLSQIQVLDNDSVINGVPGIKFLERIKLNTSTGMPWNTKKRSMLKSQETVDGLLTVEFDDEIMARVDQIIQNYKDGELNSPIFCAHLKDEPVSEKKQISKKTRVFCGAPLDFTIVVRKFFLGAIRCMQNNSFLFEAAPGINHSSKQWEDLAGYLTHFGCDRIIAGDYAAYDKNMAGYVIYEAFNVIIKLAELGGADAETIKIMRGIAQDTSYPTINFFGDLIQFFGSNPSGHPLTVTINGIVNSMYMRYAYMTLNPNHDLVGFKDTVHLMTYGDDNIMGVSSKTPWFNHTAIAKVLADAGITYTMADKEAKSVPYSHISEVNFLKRGFRYDPKLDIVQAPISHESIEKTLTTCVLSKSVALEQQSVDAMTSCLCEYFQYGEEIFNRARKTFAKVLTETELLPWVQDHNMPIYNDLVVRYNGASADYEVKWPLATGHKRELTPKLLDDSDPCFLRMDDIPEKDT